MTMDFDRLSVPFEIKALSDEGEIEGYGAVFGNIDDGDDIILPGAFDATLIKARESGRMPSFLHYHRPDQICGTWQDMRSDSHGLLCKGRFLLETQCGRDRYAEAKAGALTGLSIGYRVDGPDGAEFRDDEAAGRMVRVLKRLKLREVSCVSFPMNDMARITAVKAADAVATVREFERLMRSIGFSIAQAKAIAAGGFKALSRSRDENETIAPRDEDAGVKDRTPRDEGEEHAARLGELLASLKSARLSAAR